MLRAPSTFSVFFFFNDTATTEIYTLSLHDALPISGARHRRCILGLNGDRTSRASGVGGSRCTSSGRRRSEEHTSELQSRLHLVCRLLLEKKKKNECQLPTPPSTRAALFAQRLHTW